MIKSIFYFSIKLLVALLFLFCLHLGVLYFLNIPLFGNFMIPSYLINYLLAVTIFGILFKLKNKFEHLLGFIFMGGSFVKFAVYFLFFYPVFKQDGIVSSAEALAFLSPYLLCLIIETYFLVKLLNKKT